jgi:polysaccharide biosynthesis protein PslH
MMRLLFFSRWFPYPADNGIKLRELNLIKQLSTRHEVSLVSLRPENSLPEHLDALRNHCASVDYAPFKPFRPRGAKALLGLLSPRPRSIVDMYSPELARLAQARAAERPFDLAIASEVDMALYPLALPRIKRVFDAIEISAFEINAGRATGALNKFRMRQMWSKWRRFIPETLKRYDGATAVSEPEAALIRSVAPAFKNLVVVPNGADAQHLAGEFAQPAPNRIVYAGALSYYVNYEAMRYFVGEVLPRVVEHIPDAELLMAGRLDGVDMSGFPKHPRARHVGHVADVRPFVQGAWLSVVPATIGGGTRLKLIESLALGTPVVTSTHGTSGLNVQHDREVLVGDGPDAMARAIVDLMRDPALRTRLADTGRALVREQYDWAVIARQFSDYLESIVRTR